MDKLLPEDHVLWHRLKQGDESALTIIYHRYIADLYNYGYRLSCDAAQLEDSIQDLFFKLWKQRASLSNPTSVKYYLFRALKNSLLDNLHRAKKSVQMNYPARGLSSEVTQSTEAEIIRRETVAERKDALQQVIRKKLTARQQEAINLFFYDNLTYHEVASLLALSTKSTYKLIYRALHILQRHMRDTVSVWSGLALSLVTNLFP